MEGQSESRSVLQKIAHAANEAVRELLYSHVNHLFKQWIRTLNNLLQIAASIVSHLKGDSREVQHYVLNVKLDQEQRETLAAGGETGLISGLVGRSGKEFSAYVRLDDEGNLKFRFPGQEVESQSGTGEEPAGGRTAYRAPESFLGVKLDDEQRAALEKGEETSLVRGMKGKRGIAFDAYLHRDDEGRIAFRFETRQSRQPEPVISVPAAPESVVQPASVDPVPDAQRRLADYLKEKGVFGRQFSEAELGRLFSEGQTGLLSGFSSSAGKTFDAGLQIKEGRLLLYVPERKLNTGITAIPRKLFGVELSRDDREKIAAGSVTSLIRNMKAPNGITFNGWLATDRKKQLWVKSEATRKEIRMDSLTM